jgi:von Willebrand factor type A domain
MVRRFSLPIWAARFSEVNSLLASAVCHLTALVALGLVVAAQHTNSSDVPLALDISGESDLPAGDDVVLQDVAPVGAAGDDAEAIAPVRLFDVSAMPSGEVAGIGGGNAGTIGAVTGMASVESGTDGPQLGELGGGGGGGGGGTGWSGKAATKFFGVDGYGQKFVYVVDCSGSMRDNGKFERAVYELLQSIEQLQDDQQYYIIFYNHQSYPMEAKGLVRATPEQFEKTRDWVQHARPQGGTVPQPALLKALAMKPDAIYFLSDGLFDPDTARVVRTANRGKARHIPIHTIAFVNREAEELMYTIARNSDGKYRYVP